MADIQYLNYGDLQIELLALLNNLANNVQNYVAKQSWSNKRKLKFMSAYSDLMNKGILGASNGTGQWMIDVNGDIDLNSMDRKDREMYQEAAYFIQLQMAGLPTRASQEEKKEEDKSKLPVFDNKYFTTNFMSHIGHDRFGGRDWTSSEWNEIDKRGDNGLRGTNERAKALAGYLRSYSNSLEEGKYNFEGSPFTDLNDFKTRINTAISELENGTWNLSDKDALNRIGLNPADWFNNGSGDPSGKYDENGNPISYEQLAEYNAKLEELKAQLDAEKAKLALLTAYNNTLFINRVTNNKMLGQNPVALKEKYKGDQNALIQTLNTYALLDIRTLTPDQLSEVLGAYRYLAKDPIDNKLLKQLLSSSSGLYKNATPNRFRKIKGIDNLIWDSIANLVILISNRELNEAMKNVSPSLFDGILTKEEIQNTPISKEGWTSADTADVVSMIGDLVSLGGFWANIGGTATSLTSDIYSDYTRGKDLGDILKGIGMNLGWGLVGMLPGAKSTKVAVRAARLVPKAFMLAQSAGIVLDPEVQKSALKFTKPSEYKNISSKDLENLKYLFHAVTGGTNIAKSHYRAKQYRENLNKQEVKTTEGTKLLSNKQIKEINKVGRKGGLKAAQNKFKEYTGQEVAEGQFKFSEKGTSKFNPIRYSSTLSKFSSNDKLLKGKQVIDEEALNNLLQEDKARPWYHWNKGYPRFELTPFRNIFRKDFDKSKLISTESGEVSPYAKKPLEQGEIKKSDHIEGLPDKSSKEEILIRRDVMNDYRKTIKEGKFSSKDMEGGKESIKIGSEDVRVYSTKHADGSPSITITTSKGNHNFRSLEEAKKFIASIVKQLKNNIVSGKITKTNMKEIGKILLDLKRKGWLKQGGTIDKQKIQKYKEFINK